MTDLPALTASNFPAFFEAVHGHPPFPWQTRLATNLVSAGTWPDVLDIPTGCGKTAALDVAVFHLAMQAGEHSRNAPLRIVYVVDRRTIVDQAFDRARSIAAALLNGEHPVLATVRGRLASYGRDRLPLDVALLRGGIARNDLWARCPDQPLIAVSTVDQVGSRLLFRGYGVSDSMRPVHAGLLGNDALYLLDEVHLSQPFRETLQAISCRYRGWAERQLGSPFAVVEMSATPGDVDGESFELDADDLDNELLSRRIEVAKQAELIESSNRSLLAQAEAAVGALETATTIAVVVNRVATARDLHSRLRAKMPDADVHLLTGRMRPLDRDALEGRVLPRIAAGRTRDAAARTTVVVATQCIEAGADFDFDALVTECASLDSLRQRFGRLDRLGLHGSARGVILGNKDTFTDDPVYGDAIGRTWDWLQARRSTSNLVDFGIGALRAADGIEAADLLAPKVSAPLLLPAHLDAWVQTSPRPTPDPDVALWLHGPRRGTADVQIVWRCDLEPELLTLAEAGDDEARAAALAIVHALQPSSAEAVAIPFGSAMRWLRGQEPPPLADVEGMQDPDEERHEDTAAQPRLAVIWRGDDSLVGTPRDIRPGDTIVVPASYGGLAHGSWSPLADERVSDIAEIAFLRQRGRLALRLIPEITQRLFGDSPRPPSPAPEDTETIDDTGAVVAWLEAVPQRSDADGAALLTGLRDAARTSDLRVERVSSGIDPPREHLLVSARRRAGLESADVSTEDDSASFTGVRSSLATHLHGVGQTAESFASKAGLPESIIADVRLSGRWHDLGKIDPRFQRLLHGGSAFKALVQSEPLAKSPLPITDGRDRRRAFALSGYPKGARHELLSVALMQGVATQIEPHAADWDLVLHLVASHHGRCRPFAPWVDDPEPTPVSWQWEGVAIESTSAHDLARLDSGVAERFWQLIHRYGWWGLAWIETVLRLGDHRQSEDEQRTGGRR